MDIVAISIIMSFVALMCFILYTYRRADEKTLNKSIDNIGLRVAEFNAEQERNRAMRRNENASLPTTSCAYCRTAWNHSSMRCHSCGAPIDERLRFACMPPAPPAPPPGRFLPLLKVRI